jgi:hypothetical protein
MALPIEDIPGLSTADKAALKSKQKETDEGPKPISTTDDLWIAIAQNSQFVTSLGLAVNADKKRVLQGLAVVAIEQSKSITRNSFSMHVADLIVEIAVLLSLLYVLGVDQIRPVMHQAELFLIGPRYVVAAPQGLFPFQIIHEGDVELSDGSKPKTLESFAGRYASHGISHGAVIDQSELSSGLRLSSFDGFEIFDVKLQPTVLFAGVRLPVEANVSVSPHTKDPHSLMMMFGAYVLSVDSQKDGVAVVLAVTQDDFRKIAPTLPQSEFFAVGPVR